MGRQPNHERGIGRWQSDLVTVSTSATLGLMVIQFLTGTWLNLFVAFPEVPSSSLSDTFGAMTTSLMPTVHLMGGILLLILSMVIIAVFMDSGETKLAMLTLIGLSSVTLAALSGTEFASSGFQNDAYSYLMAVGFIAAFTSYSALMALHRAKP